MGGGGGEEWGEGVGVGRDSGWRDVVEGEGGVGRGQLGRRRRREDRLYPSLPLSPLNLSLPSPLPNLFHPTPLCRWGIGIAYLQ